MVSLPESNNLHLTIDGWKTILSFWDTIFSGATMLVSGSFKWCILFLSFTFSLHLLWSCHTNATKGATSMSLGRPIVGDKRSGVFAGVKGAYPTPKPPWSRWLMDDFPAFLIFPRLIGGIFGRLVPWRVSDQIAILPGFDMFPDHILRGLIHDVRTRLIDIECLKTGSSCFWLVVQMCFYFKIVFSPHWGVEDSNFYAFS